MNIILQIPRLILRQFTIADAAVIQQLNSAPEVLKYIHEPLLENAAQAEQVLVNNILPQCKKNLGRWAVHTKHNNEFIGWCGLKLSAETSQIDLKYRFKNAWGHCYATKAARDVLDYGFHQLYLKTIIAEAQVENLASINVVQKIGMQFLKKT